MTRILFLCGAFAACAAAFAAPEAMAADARDVAADVSGKCKKEELMALPEINQQHWQDGLGYSFIVKKDAKLMTTGAVRTEEVDKPLDLFKRAVIFGKNDETGKILVTMNEGALCGWADPSILLLRNGQDLMLGYGDGPNPLLMKDGPDAAKHPENVLNMKLVVQNLRREGGEGAPVYDEPGASNPRPERLKLFNVYEVFQAAEAIDARHQEKRRYYLIGTKGNYTELGTLVGWVHDDDAIVWDNRMTVFWNGTKEAKGYADEIKLREKRNPIASEPDTVEEPEDGVVQRFPVVEQSPTIAEMLPQDAEGGTGASVTPADLEKKIRFYRVAVPGEACEANAQDCIGASEASRKARNLDLAKKNLRNIDVLFLIDATSSMQVYIDAVRKSIETFLRDIPREGLNIRIGAAVYGDYAGAAPSLNRVQYDLVTGLTDLNNPDFSLIQDLRDVKLYDDPQKDKPEASFAAIIKAAGETRWRDNAGLRMIVNIGDHGNRPLGETSAGYPAGAPGSPLRETFGEAEVAKALATNKALYFPIAVRGDFRAEVNELFKMQARKLQELAPGNAFPVAATYQGGQAQENEDDRVQAIVQGLLQSVNVAKHIRDSTAAFEGCVSTAADASRCQLPEAPGGAGGHLAKIVADLRREHGLTAEEIRIYKSRAQTIAPYYFAPRTAAAPQKQVFSFWIAMEPAALARLSSITYRLCEVISTPDGLATLQESLNRIVEGGSGDEQSAGELLQKRLFIPAFHLNPLLHKKWRNIESEVRRADDARKDQLQKKFCKASFQLDMVLKNKKLPDGAEPEWISDRKRFEDTAQRARTYKWLYAADGGLPLYYVPVSYLP